MPVGTKLPNNVIAYEDSKLMINEESSNSDARKSKMKEVSSILAV